MYDRTANINVPKVVHFSTLLHRSAKEAQAQWAEYRRMHKPELLGAFYLGMKDLATNLYMLIRALEIDPTVFRLLPAIFEKSSEELAVTTRDHNSVPPAMLGRITMALKDIYLVSQDLIEDSRVLGNTGINADALVYGSDLGVVLTSLVPIAKTLRLNLQPFVRARNEVLNFFKVVSDELVVQTPVGPPVVEVPESSIVLACRMKHATAMIQIDPQKACALLDDLVSVLR